jgi:hypothetical protein
MPLCKDCENISVENLALAVRVRRSRPKVFTVAEAPYTPQSGVFTRVPNSALFSK